MLRRSRILSGSFTLLKHQVLRKRSQRHNSALHDRRCRVARYLCGPRNRWSGRVRLP